MVEVDPLIADFAERAPDAFARVLNRGSAAEVSAVVARLPPARKASIVARLPGAQIHALLESSHHSPGEWLSDGPFDDAVVLLSRIPRDRRLALVNSLDNRERRRRLLRHQQYPKHSIGWLVRDVSVRINVDDRAVDVLGQLREIDSRDPGPLIVVNADGRHVGLLNLWLLISRDPPAGIVRDYVLNVQPLYPETSMLSALENESWLSHNWLPVIDHRRRVLGGVSRAALHRAADAQPMKSRRSADVLVDVMTELVYVLGALLDTLVGRRRSS